MESDLSDLLSQYCDHLLGDNTVNSQTIALKSDAKKIKRKNKHESILETKSEESPFPTPKKEKRQMANDSAKRKKTKNKTILESVKEVDTGMRTKKKISNKISINVERACDTQEIKEESSDNQGLKTTRTRERVTEDGYKIVSSVPDDDSDISDAFECDSDDGEELSAVNINHECNKKTEDALRVPRKTNDGFKIVTEIPPDDSDVSDAFCEEDCVDTELSLMTGGSQLKDKRTYKKPILQLMDDFGFDDSILFEKRDKNPRVASTSKKYKSKKVNSHTLAQAARKKQKEVVILDYTIKRGSNKKKTTPNEEEDIGETHEFPSEAVMNEKELKQARYDVFKLGMSGFHKEKKQDTRISLAIKLGAKPPKNKAVSYKDLLIMKKEEKQKTSEEWSMKPKMGLKVTKPSKNKLKDGKKVKGFASQVGTFRDGVQVLSKKDIAKINAS